MTISLDRGVLLYSLRRYIMEKRQYLHCVVTDQDIRDELSLLFMNIHNVILNWDNDGVAIHVPGEKMKRLYMRLKVQLCLLITERKREFILPERGDQDLISYWSTILHVIKDVKDLMNVHLVLTSPSTIRITHKLW